MHAPRWLLAFVLAIPGFGAANYSSASIVNSATNLLDGYAPNTIITIYGERMAYDTKGIAAADVQSGKLPTVIKGVRVLVNNIPAGLYYISPTQINCLVPGLLIPSRATVQVVHDGLAGPEVRLTLRRTAPALYQLEASTAIATLQDGTLITRDAPAKAGDLLTLYATGLGRTDPDLMQGEIATFAAKLKDMASFQVFLNGTELERSRILYAGLAPGFAGLYQINLRLPDNIPADPEIRIAAAEEISPPNIFLRVEAH
jgi:uncharacterized protein (TIGR03437 family)